MFREKCQSSDEYFKLMVKHDEVEISQHAEIDTDSRPRSPIKEESEIVELDFDSFDAEELLIDQFKEYKSDDEEVTNHEPLMINQPISHKRRSKQNGNEMKKQASSLVAKAKLV